MCLRNLNAKEAFGIITVFHKAVAEKYAICTRESS